MQALGKRLGKAIKPVGDAIRALSREQIAAYEASGQLTVQGHALEEGDLRVRLSISQSINQSIKQTINQSITHFQQCAGCVRGVFGFCLSMNPHPELPVTNCAAASEHPGCALDPW